MNDWMNARPATMRWGVLAQMSSHSQGFSSLQTIDLSNPVAKQFIQENTSTEPVNSSSLSFAFHGHQKK